jgi:hypothetical protein
VCGDDDNGSELFALAAPLPLLHELAVPHSALAPVLALDTADLAHSNDVGHFPVHPVAVTARGDAIVVPEFHASQAIPVVAPMRLVQRGRAIVLKEARLLPVEALVFLPPAVARGIVVVSHEQVYPSHYMRAFLLTCRM